MNILDEIESARTPLSVTELKAVRLARLLSDADALQTLLRQTTGEAETKSTAELEHTVAKGRAVLESKLVLPGRYEGKWAVNDMAEATRRLASRRSFVYDYAARKHIEVRFSRLAEDVFARQRSRVDASIGCVVPEAVRKLVAVHDNLDSDNPEDWSNAAHSCRRVLQDLADVVFPPQTSSRTRDVGGQARGIKLGREQYINRLVAYIEDSSESDRFREIVGSHLRYMGDRLDALFSASQKGSHGTVTREEADRCVVYTYLLVGDVLSLRSPLSEASAPPLG